MSYKGKSEPSAEVTFEEDHSAENLSRCPGYRVFAYPVGAVDYETLVRCEDSHPHQIQLKIVDGIAREIPAYPFAATLETETNCIARASRKEKASTVHAESPPAREALESLQELVGKLQKTKVQAKRKPYLGRKHTAEQIHQQGLHLVP